MSSDIETWLDRCDERGGLGASVTLRDQKRLVAELRKTRAALEEYACAGDPAMCNQARLKDGSCILELTGGCGKTARAALEGNHE